MADKKEQTKANGMPDIPPSTVGSYKFAVIIPVVSTAIGFGIAYGINSYADAAAVAKKVAAVQAMDGQWLYASAFIFSKTVQVLNNIPMKFKEEVLTQSSGNNRANMFFYRALAGSKDSSLIGLETEGAIGEYNRANRSVQHFIENSLGFVLAFPLVAYVFPKQSCAIMGTFALGRVLHQLGYTRGYGGHALGFVLSLLSTSAIDGLGLLVAGKCFGYL